MRIQLQVGKSLMLLWGRLSSLPLDSLMRLAGWKACPTKLRDHQCITKGLEYWIRIF
jgi:hypothetical protein